MAQDDTVIVRPANKDWACQTERCHTLSNKTSLQQIRCYSLCTLYSCKHLKRRRQELEWPTLYVSMAGKRVSIVCCWGPAAFHFPGWICFESFWGGEVCTFFKFSLYDKTGLNFKPDIQ